MTIEPSVVGKRIAEARKRRGWTQMTFALEAGVTPSTVTRWEGGQLPPTHRLMRLAETLGVDPSVLITDEVQDLGELARRLSVLEERVAALEAVCPGLHPPLAASG